jgi:thiol-disulfide isomerase/thioredoxin
MSEDDPALSPAPATRGILVAAIAGLLIITGACDRPGEPSPPADSVSNPAPALPAIVPATPALKAGDKLPALAAEGWVNGTPPSPSAPGVRLLVVDVWALWCPYCKQGAPGLVGLFQKYSARGVAFVSLTNMSREATTQFAEQFGLTWPNGYGATAETIAALGAGSGLGMPGYGVAPTLYLVGPDGKILWSDEQARFHHTDSAKWRQDVERAIDTALTKDSAPPR